MSNMEMILCIHCKNQGIETKIPEFKVDSLGRNQLRRSCGQHNQVVKRQQRKNQK